MFNLLKEVIPISTLIKSPAFGILISLAAFEIGCLLYKKTKLSIFNPLFISIVIVILFLTTFHISLDDYNKGGQLISFFLSPATVILAVPLFNKRKLLKENFVPIILGISIGTLVGLFSIIILSHVFGLSEILKRSLLPKSVTVPIGIEISKNLGGIPSITAVVIIMTGIIGAVIAPLVCKIFKIKDKVAIGIAIGTSSHAVGTTKAVELGETEGAMSGLAIGVAGLITVFAAPYMAKFLESFM